MGVLRARGFCPSNSVRRRHRRRRGDTGALLRVKSSAWSVLDGAI